MKETEKQTCIYQMLLSAVVGSGYCMTGGSHCPQKRKLIGRSVQAETVRVKNTSCVDRVDAASRRAHVQHQELLDTKIVMMLISTFEA